MIERFGPGAVVVRDIPDPLGELAAQTLLPDLADELAEMNRTTAPREHLEQVHSCAKSVGSEVFNTLGRKKTFQRSCLA